MRVTHTVDTFDSPAAWSRLGRMLGGESLGVVQNTIRHLRVLKAKSYTLKAQNPVQPPPLAERGGYGSAECKVRGHLLRMPGGSGEFLWGQVA